MATTIANNFISPRAPFEIVIKTDNLSTGSSANNQFRIPHYTLGTYNYQVDWGDGVVEEVRGNTSPTHTYVSIGTYNVKIWGIFHGINFNGTGDRLKLLSILSVDLRNANTWLALSNAFNGCNNLTNFPFMNTGHITSLLNSWIGCAFSSFPLIDTSNVTNFINTWNGCLLLLSVPFLDVSKGTTFQTAWFNCPALVNFPANFFDTWTATPALRCFENTWSGCPELSAQSASNILISIDVSGRIAPAGATGTQADVRVDYKLATGSLSAAALTAITNLKGKGWKPRINNLYV